MKKEKRNVALSLEISNGKVAEAKCTCPAGLSGYCNHVMALLLEIADYSLNQLDTVPDEISCTSRLRQCGVPGETSNKAPVIDTIIQSQTSSRGISSTLFDPRRLNNSEVYSNRLLQMQNNLSLKDKKIGFSCCVPPKESVKGTINTRYGEFVIGSPLSFHLNTIGFATKVETNIMKLDNPVYTVHEYTQLPLKFIDYDHETVPKNWVNTSAEESYLTTIRISDENSRLLETDTVKQSKCELWKHARKWKIVSSEAHKVFIRKKDFKSLVDIFLIPKEEKHLPYAIKENFKHRNLYEPLAREKYENIMQFYLNRDVQIRETGCVIQPNLFWLVARADGLVSDRSVEDKYVFGLIEIKCPKNKKNHTIDELISDESFYINRIDGKLVLKKEHSSGYYTQIQLAMGLSGAMFCDFVVFVFDGMIIVRTPFDVDYFIELVPKLNDFYKKFLLPEVLERYNKEDNT